SMVAANCPCVLMGQTWEAGQAPSTGAPARAGRPRRCTDRTPDRATRLAAGMAIAPERVPLRSDAVRSTPQPLEHPSSPSSGVTVAAVAILLFYEAESRRCRPLASASVATTSYRAGFASLRVVCWRALRSLS